MDLFERRAEMPLLTVKQRSSAHSVRGRFQNKGVTCWLGSLLQALLSSEVFHCFLALHRPTPSCKHGCPVCNLVATERCSREVSQICAVEPLWRSFVEQVPDLRWVQQQDPLHFFLYLCNASPHFFSHVLGATLDATVTQTLPCTCDVEVPPPHHFPRQLEFIVPLKVPQSAFGMSSLVHLISLMEEERPDNSTRCPICDVQAGFYAKNTWGYGPVIFFQLTRSAKDTDQITLDSHLSLGASSYALRAAVCHRGEIDSGHYVCFVLESRSGLWVRYNDGDLPARLSQAPQCLSTHCAYAVYERAMPPEDLAAFCNMTVHPRCASDEAIPSPALFLCFSILGCCEL